ncbi:O-Antigen ligase [Noviherbaspirillum humi]|uniref:O-Antigen ligase n=1 Tax=Noviherbaspirillum humi TaxID=1688639 RepID=A0A239C2P6_9BURK|nr:O-antigen ligase family protein [Noviherbaspirillum humi]SNS14565.1 O-Antigen ligase [Noviherbaspirillum humi]
MPHLPASHAGRLPGAAVAQGGAAFRLFWGIGLLALVLNLGQVFNLGNINAIEKLLLLIAALAYLRHKPIAPAAAWGVALILLAVLVPGALTSFPAFTWERVLLALLALLALLGFLLAPPTPSERSLMLVSIAWLPALVLGYGLLLNVSIGRPLFMVDHTGSTRLGGATFPAFLAAACYASAIASALLYAQRRHPLYLMLAASSLAVCTLSGTRMPTACATASTALILLFAMRHAGARLALMAGGLLIGSVFLLTAGDQILRRIQSGSSSGRDQIWSALARWSDLYPYTGIGFGGHSFVIPYAISRQTSTSAAHNEYLRLLVELGYPGEAVFLAGLLLIFVAALRAPGAAGRCCCLAVLALYFLYAATDNVLYLSYTLFIPLALSLGSPFLGAQGDGRAA